MQELHEQLRKKGWSYEEIEHAKRIIDKHKIHDKSESRKDLNRLVYWMSLLVLMICNLLVAVFLVPFLLVLEDFFLYVIIGVLGLIFGLFFNLLIQDIEHLEKHHHLVAATLIPVFSVINIFIMVRVSGRIASFMELDITNNPVISSLIYVWAFVLPYLVSMFRKE